MNLNTYALTNPETGNTDNYVDFRSYSDGVWFGDPCYVVPDGHSHEKNYWEPLIDMMYEKKKFTHTDGKEYDQHVETFDSRNTIRVVEVDDEKFYMWSTAYGDGCYPITLNDRVVDKLGVDAGCLSVVPVKLLNLWDIGPTEAKQSGFISEGPGLHGFMAVEEGDFRWNNWDILTGPNAYEDEYGDEEEEEYYC